MGYRARRHVYVLDFTGDPFYEGLEVRLRPPTVGESLQHLDTSWIGDASLSDAERLGRQRTLFEVLAGRLDGWNLEDDNGDPVPVTLDGLMSIDTDLGYRIARSWLFETSSVPAPLVSDSPAGRPPVDETEIPMGPSPLAQAS